MAVATILDSADTAGAIVWAALIFFTYFGPTFVGWRKPNAFSIFAMNLFLGWTVIGWIVALVWALSADSPAGKKPAPAQVEPAATTAPLQPVPQPAAESATDVHSARATPGALGRAVRWLKTPISSHP